MTPETRHTPVAKVDAPILPSTVAHLPVMMTPWDLYFHALLLGCGRFQTVAKAAELADQACQERERRMNQ